MPAEPRARILVVDDDDDIREALRDTLEQEGYEAAVAIDGSDALHYLGSNPPPTLILLDWNMTPMNGPEFMAEFLKRPDCTGIPVVLVTADTRAAEKGSDQGFVACLRKPIRLPVLFELLERHCGHDPGRSAPS